MKNILLIITFLVGFTSVVAGWVLSPREESPQPETMPLVPMMQQLLTNMYQVDNGIYTENFELIIESAGNISDHPAMTVKDKKVVKSTLGTEMKQFVKYDMIVHHHADSMRLAAIQQNMQEILHHYHIVQQGCVDCHSNYRESISSARSEGGK
ncbi:hypothetical protein SAMN05443144_107160 [Fodinibius roseus]|uniref:Cytochrome C n=1 Tax=Fodinibius roseus TaxID=1194090 RepID=A0A1M5ASH1_9BACT|nr:hypothetical protein [Fodinibius roseus]SHF33181.1 hypothetical protein SAMN05443144_107160 [Fodinibius roseus]